MTMKALAAAHTALQKKASKQDFTIIGYELFENFGDFEGNVVLSAYGPNGEHVYAEVK